ncbi:PIN domain-containing protein [Roseateles sp. P5_E4]
MDTFHIIFDTSLLRQTPFGHPNFARLLRRVQQGVAKLYIPLIVLEERRTQLLDDYDEVMVAVRSKLGELKRGSLGMICDGIVNPDLRVPSRADLDRHSVEVLRAYLAANKIEVLPFTGEHGDRAWARYFNVSPPFNGEEKREKRRRDIPDSWILEAALDIKAKAGRHIVLVRDGKLEGALRDDGFEIWKDIELLDAAIEEATAVVPIRGRPLAVAAVPLDQLRSKRFENLDRIVLGMIDAWETPVKDELFSRLEALGIPRDFAEHEAKTLQLSGMLQDIGNRYLPMNPETARLAAEDPLVQDLLVKSLDL